MVADPCVKMVSHALWNSHSQSWSYWIMLMHHGRKEKPGHSVYSESLNTDLTFSITKQRMLISTIFPFPPLIILTRTSLIGLLISIFHHWHIYFYYHGSFKCFLVYTYTNAYSKLITSFIEIKHQNRPGTSRLLLNKLLTFTHWCSITALWRQIFLLTVASLAKWCQNKTRFLTRICVEPKTALKNVS